MNNTNHHSHERNSPPPPSDDTTQDQCLHSDDTTRATATATATDNKRTRPQYRVLPPVQLDTLELGAGGGMKPARSWSVMIGQSAVAGHDSIGGTGANTARAREGAAPARLAPPHGPGERRRNQALFSQYSMPCSLDRDAHRSASMRQIYDLSRAQLDERIIYCQLSLAAHKNFCEEVRALADVRKFVCDAFISTELQEVRIGAICERIVDELAVSRCLATSVVEEAKSMLFVERNSLNMMLANTMQGIYKARRDGRLAYDQSWLVATCSLVSLSKRHVAIARFAQPVNFGRHAQEVRFLIIVLAPSREKLTKSAWETGRTFSTMFTDVDFRRRLLRAKTRDEMRAELLASAEFLAQAGRQRNESVFSQATLAPASGHNHHNHHHHQATKIALINGSSAAAALTGTTATASADLFGPRINKLAVLQLGATNGQPAHRPDKTANSCCWASLGAGLCDDLRRRSKFYLSDYTDGLVGHRSLYKTVSTTVFLYFSVLLPCIAFGVVDTNNTDGAIDPKKTMIGQALGGLFFALFSGQPLVVVMTTAPLCIYVKVIYEIAHDLGADFGAFYGCVGLWMALFLVCMSVSNASNLMRYCTRSTEDIFALFTAFAFGMDGVREAIRSFRKYYNEPACHPTVGQQQQQQQLLAATAAAAAAAAAAASQPAPQTAAHLVHNLIAAANNATQAHEAARSHHYELQHGDTVHQAAGPEHGLAACQRETCILFLFLMFGTLWLANSFNAFDRTPYLSARKREIIKDYALAFAVLIFSFVASYLFADIKLDVFEFGDFVGLQLAPLGQLTPPLVALACPLGFILSVLFYIDQNICGAMVNNAPYKLKKGDYFHLDLLALAVLNSFLSLTGLPWMQGKLPHSHLHSKALADYEERVDEGHIHQTIVQIRETRLTGALCSLLIGLSVLATPYPLSYIPLPVLSGVFLYTALAEFKSNSMVERVCLLFTEQTAYPPNHYIRRCPQRNIHLFTLIQLVQLAIVSLVGFFPNPYVNMSFPLIVATFVPVRELFMPRLIDTKYLSSLDHASLEY